MFNLDVSATETGVSPHRRRPYSRSRSLVGVAALIVSCVATPTAAATVAALGDASIVHDEAARSWVLNAGGARLVVSLNRSRDFQILALDSPSGHNWLPSSQPGTSVLINGKSEAFGSRSGGFDLEEVSTENTGFALRLHATFHYRPANLRVVRHFAIADGSPTFETWTTFEPLGRAAIISDLNAFDFSVSEGVVHWLNGLRGDNMDQEHLDAFTLKSQRIEVGERLSLGAQGRSSEESVPWFSIDGEEDEFFAALMWSGAWNLSAFRSDERLSLSMGLTNVSTEVTNGIVEGPHALFGAARGGLPQASAALRAYVAPGLRAGRPFNPLVTFNTWFADGTRIADASVRDEMLRAAALGTELFVLDAGWYAGAGAEGVFDFSSGLGRWQPDPDRFPHGLKAMTDYAHLLGMKFGMWVEPERADLSTIGETGLEEGWLATAGGQQVTERTGQVCLAGAAGRQWLLDRLTTLIDEVQPDYLKWDNNAWLNCDREGHGHNETDGNFAHVSALYGMLAALRERYPDLMIENVSGGGNRLDFGMLRYTDVGWMNDRSGPSVHVRHSFEGLSAAFPPAYLLGFVIEHDAERLNETADLSLYFRSRMLGTLGMSFPLKGLTGIEAMAGQIQTYKRLRSTLVDATGSLLTLQAQSGGGPAWDVFQCAGPQAQQIIVYAFQVDCGDMLTVRPTDLQADSTYLVESLDFGPIGTAQGAELMADGIEVFSQHNTNAQILTLTRTESPPDER